METNILSISKDLKRYILNKNGFFCLSTESADGLEYAFYLKHPGGTEKVFYTSNAECIFDIPFNPGSYVATFFYRVGKEKKAFKDSFHVTKSGRVLRPEKILLGEEEGWKICYYDNGSKITFVVFNGSGSTKNSSPFGLGYLIGKGYNVVACLQENDQYQSLTFEKFKHHVLPVVNEKKVFLYGSSLGGYCAVYYAGAVNGTVIASAPRNSAHPEVIDKSNGKSRFNKDDFKHGEISGNPLTEKNIYIFFDPYVSNDVFFINSFVKKAYPKIKEFPCNHAGHEVLFHINKTKQLDGVVTSIVSGEEEVFIDEGLDSCFSNIGRAKYFLSKKQYEKAAVFSEKALKDKTLNEKLRGRFKKVHDKALKNIRDCRVRNDG